MSDLGAVTFSGGVAVTPSDLTPIAGTVASPKIFAGFYVGGGSGEMTVVTADGDTLTFTGLITGREYRTAITYVKSTGTNATGILALRGAGFVGDRG